MYNDFVLVGPRSDPAEIGGMTDAAAAAGRIARSASAFTSRGDESGTHAAELRIWQAAGIDPDVSLDGARELLDRATGLLSEDDPPSASAALDVLRAQILYDVGSRDALEQALAAVTRASRVWQGQGEPLRAARLLNDEAAIWVRLGDPVRANHLLAKSLEVFGQLAHEDAAARAEEVTWCKVANIAPNRSASTGPGQAGTCP